MAKIIEGDNVCAISMEEIETDDFYMTCDVCHKNYKSNILREWLQRDNSCPTCRSPWTTQEKPRLKEYRNCKPKERGFFQWYVCNGKINGIIWSKRYESRRICR